MTEIMSRNHELIKKKSKGHNSVKNYSAGTKLELDLRILMINLHTKFQLKMLMHDRDNERKP